MALDESKDKDYDEWNLSPTITYRHLISHGAGVHNPLRVIGLCDMDAFYAQCEQKRLGIDPKQPLVVLQWELLIAVNYPARAYGIKRMTKLEEAKKMCPELVIVHVATYKDGESEPKYHPNPDTTSYKVSLDLYRRESVKIIEIFKSVLPTAEIEKASVDEAFIDFTNPVRQIIIERYPELVLSHPDDLDAPLPPPPQTIDWHSSCNLIPINAEEDSTVEDPAQGSPSKAKPEPAKREPLSVTWHDIALSIGGELMFMARNEIFNKLGYTTSAGIARNKFLAKLSASFKKPASQSVLRNAAIPHYLTDMPFQKIRFLGGKLGSMIAKEYEASTVGDLLSISLSEMQEKLGIDSIWVYQIFRGIDVSEVKEKPSIPKSMLASKNLPKPIRNDADMVQWSRVLCSELAVRALEGRESWMIWPKTLVLHTRQAGEKASKSKQASFPYVRELTGELIGKAVMKLWKELHGTDAQRPGNPNSVDLKIIYIGIAFTGLEPVAPGQRAIDGFFSKSTRTPPILENDSNVMKEEIIEEIPKDERLEYVCPECSKRIEYTVLSNDHEEIRATKLLAIKSEHEDFHFAQRLAREHKVVVGGGVGKRRQSTSQDVQNKRRKDEGIKNYFQKKWYVCLLHWSESNSIS
ncbi:DNA/RNA polymerase [Serendipita vermifera]|nr:DNA/RNA polymerase [Serendipita vermifera]